MKQLTCGDAVYVYGNTAKCDYTVRLSIRMDENVDGKILAAALEKTRCSIREV